MWSPSVVQCQPCPWFRMGLLSRHAGALSLLRAESCPPAQVQVGPVTALTRQPSYSPQRALALDSLVLGSSLLAVSSTCPNLHLPRLIAKPMKNYKMGPVKGGVTGPGVVVVGVDRDRFSTNSEFQKHPQRRNGSRRVTSRYPRRYYHLQAAKEPSRAWDFAAVSPPSHAVVCQAVYGSRLLAAAECGCQT